METISFKLDVFEGPLDLLLHLIAKHKLNINDIEISKLLEQYLLYIEQAKEQDLELAGEFLEMAARLIYIKTASLLPKPEEAEEIKKELQGTLIEYSACKRAAEKLKASYTGNDIFVREPLKIKLDSVYKLEHPPEKLAEIYLNMHIKKTDFRQANEKKINDVVQQKVVSVISKVVYVLKTLYKNGSAYIDSMFDGMTGRSERVATFLAILELTKSGRIVISDDNTMISFKKKGDNFAAE
ncbi:segregation and condensation protein A [Porcipelethomonas sp.]|uniref:segregation and condensation protein A n=1 Tax=Porcipelethomonas sp. TaxID=2981675 RepID=UPI003EFA3561